VAAAPGARGPGRQREAIVEPRQRRGRITGDVLNRQERDLDLEKSRVSRYDADCDELPRVPARAGHYESLDVKVCHPSEPRDAGRCRWPGDMWSDVTAADSISDWCRREGAGPIEAPIQTPIELAQALASDRSCALDRSSEVNRLRADRADDVHRCELADPPPPFPSLQWGWGGERLSSEEIESAPRSDRAINEAPAARD